MKKHIQELKRLLDNLAIAQGGGFGNPQPGRPGVRPFGQPPVHDGPEWQSPQCKRFFPSRRDRGGPFPGWNGGGDPVRGSNCQPDECENFPCHLCNEDGTPKLDDSGKPVGRKNCKWGPGNWNPTHEQQGEDGLSPGGSCLCDILEGVDEDGNVTDPDHVLPEGTNICEAFPNGLCHPNCHNTTNPPPDGAPCEGCFPSTCTLWRNCRRGHDNPLNHYWFCCEDLDNPDSPCPIPEDHPGIDCMRSYCATHGSDCCSPFNNPAMNPTPNAWRGACKVPFQSNPCADQFEQMCDQVIQPKPEIKPEVQPELILKKPENYIDY